MLINFFIAISLGLVFCFIFRKLSKDIGLVDIPDGVRKTHTGKIPLGGGLSICFTYFICSLIFVEFNSFFFVLLVATTLLLVIGLLDDFSPLPVFVRLIAQIILSWAVIIFTDVYVKDLGNLFGVGSIYLGQLGIPITIFMVVGVCNAFNMLDGMDGFVSVVSFIAISCLSVISYINNVDFSWAIALSGALIAFFIFNVGLIGRRFQMFLGDSGAMMIGFFIAWILVFYSQEPQKIISPVYAIWIIILPLIDALSAFYRRLRSKEKIFLGDRKHIHYILLDSGYKKINALLIFVYISLVSCLTVILASLFLVEDYYLFYGFLTLWFFYLLTFKYPNQKKK